MLVGAVGVLASCDIACDGTATSHHDTQTQEEEQRRWYLVEQRDREKKGTLTANNTVSHSGGTLPDNSTISVTVQESETLGPPS